MRIEEFLGSRSTAGGAFLNEQEIGHLVEYINKFPYLELLDFCAQMSHLHDITVAALDDADKGTHGRSMTGLLAFIRMIETIKDGREMLREIFNSPEFNPPTPSGK